MQLQYGFNIPFQSCIWPHRFVECAVLRNMYEFVSSGQNMWTPKQQTPPYTQAHYITTFGNNLLNHQTARSCKRTGTSMTFFFKWANVFQCDCVQCSSNYLVQHVCAMIAVCSVWLFVTLCDFVTAPPLWFKVRQIRQRIRQRTQMGWAHVACWAGCQWHAVLVRGVLCQVLSKATKTHENAATVSQNSQDQKTSKNEPKAAICCDVCEALNSTPPLQTPPVLRRAIGIQRLFEPLRWIEISKLCVQHRLEVEIWPTWQSRSCGLKATLQSQHIVENVIDGNGNGKWSKKARCLCSSGSWNARIGRNSSTADCWLGRLRFSARHPECCSHCTSSTGILVGAVSVPTLITLAFKLLRKPPKTPGVFFGVGRKQNRQQRMVHTAWFCRVFEPLGTPGPKLLLMKLAKGRGTA